MKFIITLLAICCITSLKAQKQFSDSAMNEFTRLTCECATLMNLEKLTPEEGFDKLITCVNSTLGIYVQSGWVEEKTAKDSAWYMTFVNTLEQKLMTECDITKKFFARVNRKAPEPQESSAPAYFIADAYMTGKNMEKNNVNNAQMHRWSAKDMGTATVQMVFDIRLVFTTEQEAADYMELKIDELSENGKPLDKTLQTSGTDASLVFGDNPNLTSAFGDLDLAQFNFIFRIKNVVAKVFISGSKKMGYAAAEGYAKEAIARIKAVASH